VKLGIILLGFFFQKFFLTYSRSYLLNLSKKNNLKLFNIPLSLHFSRIVNVKNDDEIFKKRKICSDFITDSYLSNLDHFDSHFHSILLFSIGRFHYSNNFIKNNDF
jgi:hypothetical protein